MKTNKEHILSIVRHSLTFLGGLMIMKGILDHSLMTEMVGAIVTIVGSVWSIIKNNKK
jgi:hypothetical protein